MTQNQPEFGDEVDIDRIASALQINKEDINTDFLFKLYQRDYSGKCYLLI